MHIPPSLLAVIVALGMSASLASGHPALPNHPAFVDSGFSGIAGITLAIGGPAPGIVLVRHNVTVVASDPTGQVTARVETDDLGLFWLPLPPGAYTLTVLGAGDAFGRRLTVRPHAMTFATVLQQMR
jgi:hypothetical protein